MPDKLGGRSLRVACQLRVTGRFKSIDADCRCTFRRERHLASSRTVPQGPRTCPWTLTPSSHPLQTSFPGGQVYQVYPHPMAPEPPFPVFPFPGMLVSPVFLWVGFPGWLSGKESSCQCGRHGFDPCVGKIPWRREWQPTPALLPGESHGRRRLGGSVWPEGGSSGRD